MCQRRSCRGGPERHRRGADPRQRSGLTVAMDSDDDRYEVWRARARIAVPRRFATRKIGPHWDREPPEKRRNLNRLRTRTFAPPAIAGSRRPKTAVLSLGRAGSTPGSATRPTPSGRSGLRPGFRRCASVPRGATPSATSAGGTARRRGALSWADGADFSAGQWKASADGKPLVHIHQRPVQRRAHRPRRPRLVGSRSAMPTTLNNAMAESFVDIVARRPDRPARYSAPAVSPAVGVRGIRRAGWQQRGAARPGGGSGTPTNYGQPGQGPSPRSSAAQPWIAAPTAAGSSKSTLL